MRSEQTSTILLVSSEPVVRSAIKEVLEGSGYVVLSAGDLSAAVEALGECPADLLIIHPYIENIPGHEAARYLRAQNPGMAVLMIAGLLNDDRLQCRADIERFQIFPPPFTGAQLLKKIRAVLMAAREREASNKQGSAVHLEGLAATKA